MNNLNSLIIEGVVKGEPHKEEVGVSKRMYFTIETELSKFKIVAYGNMCDIPLADGRGVRVVGRLKKYTWSDGGVTHSEVQVVAEHIEIRKTK